MAFITGEQVGPYTIEAELGQGGMASVFKAHHSGLDRYVAIKVMHSMFKSDDSFVRRFQREARVVAKLEHPHIIPVYDYAEHRGHPYLVMRYVEGITLKERLREGMLSRNEMVRLVTAIADGLDYAHGQGVLHRDVKPSNIMLTKGGGIFITDFGLARILQAGESTMSQGMMMGTPQYIPPEQARGLAELDHRADLYSLGVILYEMTVGRVPFDAPTTYTIIHDQIFTPPPKPRDLNGQLSPELEAVLLQALAKEPEARFASAGEMVTAFVAALLALPGEVAQAGTLLLPDITPVAQTKYTPASATRLHLPITPTPTPVAPTALSPLPPTLVEPAVTQLAAASTPSPVTPRRFPVPLIIVGLVGLLLVATAIILVMGARNRQIQADLRRATATAAAQISLNATATAAAIPTLPPTLLPPRPDNQGAPGQQPLPGPFGPDMALPALESARPIAELEPLLAANPGNRGLQLELAAAYFRDEQYEKGLQLLQPLGGEIDSPLPYIGLAEALLNQRRDNLAIGILQTGREKFPEDTGLLSLTMFLFIINEYPRPLVTDLITDIREVAPTAPVRALGDAYEQSIEVDWMTASYTLGDGLLQATGTDRYYLSFMLALVYTELDDIPAARQAYLDARSVTPFWLNMRIDEALIALPE
ncbi:MAG: protein kinase [Chloroflexi bacterium]|nr:protein kinase [Chloroflexota bacterium]MBP8055234.1 protein kinase [Chloroflexota bacterium]